MFKTNLAPLTV